MGTADEIHVVLLQEARHDVWSERKAHTSVVLAPPGDVLVGVGPQQIAEETAVRDLHASVLVKISQATVTYIRGSHHPPDLLHGVEVRAQTTVHGEDLLIDDGGDGQTVEAVGERLPQLDVVSPLALVVESVDAVDGRALVVATENEEVLGVLDLVCEEQADGLKGLLATVDVVAKEEVVGLGGETTVLEQTEQIVVLAVNISANLDECQQLATTATAGCGALRGRD